jgi:LacI family transcriptional regulator
MPPPSSRIGLLIDFGQGFCRGVLRGVKCFAETRPHWSLLPLAANLQSIQELRARHLAGVIAYAGTEELFEAVNALHRPLVHVGDLAPDLPVAGVGVNDGLVGRVAATHLLERGFRHFGFVGHSFSAASLRREAGFRQALQEAGQGAGLYLEQSSETYESTGSVWSLDAGFRRWLLALPKPAGLFVYCDLWGAQLAEACHQCGLRIPEDVALVGVGNDEVVCDLSRPPLSSVAVPAERVGYEAAVLLDRLLGGEKPPIRPLLLPPHCVVTRQSSDMLALGDPDVAAALRVIHARGHHPLSVDDVLREVPVSRRSLERRFRKLLHRGLWEEIRRVRVERAKALLTESDLPMQDVAERSGFTDGKHLSVAFRQETGLTPTTFRRRTRGQTGESLSPSDEQLRCLSERGYAARVS